jgi:hypothetical protein
MVRPYKEQRASLCLFVFSRYLSKQCYSLLIMSEQSKNEQMAIERECIHRSKHAEGTYYAGTSYIKALQRLTGTAAMTMAGKVGAFFWADAAKVKVWLCNDCANEIGL